MKNKIKIRLLIIFAFLNSGCFGSIKTDVIIQTDPNTGYESQSWFYYPSDSSETTESKLIERVLDSSLYKTCIAKGNIPKATYSEPIFSSLVLTCVKKKSY